MLQDLLFSATYWLCLERSQGPLLRMCPEGGAAPPACTKVAAFLGEGAEAEAVAAALTMLFDIVKMRAQVADELQLSTTACDYWGQRWCCGGGRVQGVSHQWRGNCGIFTRSSLLQGCGGRTRRGC